MMPISSDSELLSSLRDAVRYLEGRTNEFAELRRLLFSSTWPEATPAFAICKTETDKLDRAAAVLDDMNVNLTGKRFLDFGCGEGHAVVVAAERGAAATGYDPEKVSDNSLVTSDWDAVKLHGPYEVVLICDVLDHCDDPVAALKMVREVISPDSVVYCRCHPWTSPHGGHHYHTVNKAYAHLVFSENEQAELGMEPPPTGVRTMFPHVDNEAWFTSAGFHVVWHEQVGVEVDRFFKTNPILSRRLSRPEYKGKFPDKQLSQEFNNYVIAPNA